MVLLVLLLMFLSVLLFQKLLFLIGLLLPLVMLLVLLFPMLLFPMVLVVPLSMFFVVLLFLKIRKIAYYWIWTLEPV